MANPISGNVLQSKIDPTSKRFEDNMRAMAEMVSAIRNEEEKISEGGGAKARTAAAAPAHEEPETQITDEDIPF